MKRIFFIILFSLAFITLKAQEEKRISYATTVGTGISMSTTSSTAFTWQFVGYYKLTERWSVGAGTGLSFYKKMLIPVYGDLRFQIGRERKFTPYVECAMGYSFAPASDANGGFFMNPSIGILYPLKKNMKLQLALGYETQALSQLKKQTDSYFHKEFEEQLNQHAVSFKIGFVF